jgi:hypothetical protein
LPLPPRQAGQPDPQIIGNLPQSFGHGFLSAEPLLS